MLLQHSPQVLARVAGHIAMYGPPMNQATTRVESAMVQPLPGAVGGLQLTLLPAFQVEVDGRSKVSKIISLVTEGRFLPLQSRSFSFPQTSEELSLEVLRKEGLGRRARLGVVALVREEQPGASQASFQG